MVVVFCRCCCCCLLWLLWLLLLLLLLLLSFVVVVVGVVGVVVVVIVVVVFCCCVVPSSRYSHLLTWLVHACAGVWVEDLARSGGGETVLREVSRERHEQFVFFARTTLAPAPVIDHGTALHANLRSQLHC